MSEERRQHPRFTIPNETQAHLILEQQHRGPMTLSARLTDISETGARAVISGLLHRTYQDLIRKASIRPVRIEFSFPPDYESSRIRGQIAFFDYHGHDMEPSCTFGISFSDLDEPEKEAVEAFVRAVRAEMEDPPGGGARAPL